MLYYRVLSLAISLLLFLALGALIMRFVVERQIEDTKECPHCLSEIPFAATICAW